MNMRFAAHHLPTPKTAGHIALATADALAPAAGIARLIAGAGIDIREFSARFGCCASRDEAAMLTRHLGEWLAQHAPDHPLRSLRIMHVKDAKMSAGINPDCGFSAEVAAYERYGNDHCPAENEKWFAWLDRNNAAHSCNWRDSGTLAQDLATAIANGTDILVLHRIS
jgi:hypothetical protein